MAINTCLTLVFKVGLHPCIRLSPTNTKKDTLIEHKEVDGIWEERDRKGYKPLFPQTVKKTEGNQ